MRGNIWDILGIEPTTDKNNIQQAYAEKLKKYHPEEHPYEFQQLQDAYRKASEYARTGRHSFRDNSNTNIQFQSVGKNALVQPIPEYIAQVQNIELHSLYEEDIVRYVAFFEEKFIGYTSKKDLDEIKNLFQDNRFCTVLGLKEFYNCLSKKMDYYEMWNQKALAVLRKNTKQLLNENMHVDTNLIHIKHYFDSKVKESVKLGLAFYLYTLFIVVIVVWMLWELYGPT